MLSQVLASPRSIRLLSLTLLLTFSFLAVGQSNPIGILPYSSISIGVPDSINNANLNTHLAIPLYQKAGRGLDVSASIIYDRAQWSVAYQSISPAHWYWNWAGTGWTVGPTIGTTGNTNFGVTHSCPNGYGSGTDVDTFTYTDAGGTTHSFSMRIGSSGCNYGIHASPVSALALDGSGLLMTVNFTESLLNVYVASITVQYPNGTKFFEGAYSNGTPTGTTTLTDRNGNQVTVKPSTSSSQCYNGASSCVLVIDTLGQQALTWNVGGASNGYNYSSVTYLNTQNNPVNISIGYGGYTFSTDFACYFQYEPNNGSNGIHEGAAGSSQYPIYEVTSATLPDGTQYKVAYEPSSNGGYTGRPSSITIPSGGVISFAYTGTNNGIDCYDGSNLGLNRSTVDGTTKYSRAFLFASPYTATDTTVTDPANNQTLINFDGYGHETDRKTYQGSITSGTLLRHTTNSYGSTSGSFSFTSVTSTTQLGTLPIAQSVRSYAPNYNLLTEDDEYDFGGSSPLKKTVITYATLGNNILDRPNTVVVENGSGAIVSQVTYSYDETAVTGSGAAQLVTVSGSRGNATTINNNGLTSTNTYYDTGQIDVASDVNGASTTYTYGACGNSFPTSIGGPLGLTTAMTWNCTGGVMTSRTDPNNKTFSWIFNDPYFWRLSGSQDELGVSTNMTYPSAIQSDSSTTFNGGKSVINVVSTTDPLGRRYLSQRQQAPGSTTYDSTEIDYGWASSGRKIVNILPFSASLGGAYPSGPAKTTVFDALSRPLTISDAGGGSETFSYSLNDTLRTVGPAPTGENSKERQTEFNALGWLTSVCEISTTQPGGGSACNQNTSATGFRTSYQYDALGDLVTVNQSGQSRTYSYDGLRRITSESNPESANASFTYIYDTASSCGTTGYDKGSLVSKTDSVGNITCYLHDALRRITKVTYSGPYASVTPTKCFVYDSVAVNGQNMLNTSGRLAEAYTTTSASCTGSGKITDIGFSYSPRGEITDIYESTPNSGGYYHSSVSYFENGAPCVLAVLNNMSSPSSGTICNSFTASALPVFTTSVDGEGRPNAVSASTGMNPILSRTYCSSTGCNNNTGLVGQMMSMILGSSDSESFQYDPNTGRMTQYQSSVGATPKTDTGKLVWNANGSLSQLSIADQLNPSDNQTCNYLYDDLARLTSANCGTLWAQTFGYDVFGNLTKNGSVSFLPTYNQSTNRIALLSGCAPAYDANGNTNNDCQHTYSWDVDGHPVTIDATRLTYDALGRMVEKSASAGYNELVYGPDGSNLALMNGQTVVKGFIGNAVYSGGTLTYFRHADWLGSVRLASNTSRQMQFSLAYAPFGETYAEAGTADRSFAGMDQDTATGTPAGLYDADFRKYAMYGRWSSPDPAGLGAVAYVNPQTWNRYAYVSNNPSNDTDPLGLASRIGDGWGDWSTGFCTGSSCYSGSNIPCFAVDGASLCADLSDWTPIMLASKPVTGYVWGAIPQGDWIYGASSSQDASVSYRILGEWGWIPSQIGTGLDLSDSWAWTFTKTFFGGLVSKDGWKAVYHSFGEGGCDRLMAETFGDVFNPLPADDVGARDVGEIAPKAVAAAGPAVASVYSAYQGLSVPLRSTIYRGLQSSTYSTGAAVEEAVPEALVVYAGGKALITAGSAAYNGECH